MSEITPDDVEHIANLARLEFSRQELDQFQGNLKRILDYISKPMSLPAIGPVSGPAVVPRESRNEALERRERLEREAGTKIQLERAGTRLWNEELCGTRIVGTRWNKDIDGTR